ncbi:uncharacterized protein FIBRA_06874 [Fibroporia radiculosa]|uniref:Uncharacterized protein n=1 Tax=Fibroporia radiculosa TaxID=599839 RepID=J4GCR7_9APHY|nr:uncharacterized protein FIBRA_06874 [Fibroporia radiculosa]CCM04688.1 predicted protein [Fibroporia radiculosa]
MSEDDRITLVTSLSHLDEILAEAKAKLTIIDFYAAW